MFVVATVDARIISRSARNGNIQDGAASVAAWR